MNDIVKIANDIANKGEKLTQLYQEFINEIIKRIKL
jgi:hypothetical protein